jgi:hypothetical protein
VSAERAETALYSAAAVAFPCEEGELAADENNGACLCWVDIDTGTLAAEDTARGPQWRWMPIETATRPGCRLEVR